MVHSGEMTSPKRENQLRPISHGLLRVYKATLSPVLALFGARCRHGPSCSEYMAEAVSRHGLWAGGWMGIARLQRCRPGGSMGYDPVPERPETAVWWRPWTYGDWRGPRPHDDQ